MHTIDACVHICQTETPTHVSNFLTAALGDGWYRADGIGKYAWTPEDGQWAYHEFLGWIKSPSESFDSLHFKKRTLRQAQGTPFSHASRIRGIRENR